MFNRKNLLVGSLVGMMLVVVLLGFATLTGKDAVQAQTDDTGIIRQVTVVGEGKVNAAPDTAVVQIGVETEDKTAQDALAQNNIEATQVISKLKELSIDEKDIQTTNFNIFPTYDDKGRKVTGYRVNNTVSVKIRDLDAAGELLDEVVQVGANSIYGISFSVEDTTDLIAEARDKAMENAKEKAAQLAKGGNASVGKVLIITENVGSNPQPIMARGMGGAMAEDMAFAAEAPIQAGEQNFWSHVQVTFELE